MGRQGSAAHHQAATTRLYDERGNGIRDESHLRAVLDDAGDDAWLVPAMALTETTGERDPGGQRPSVLTTEHLDGQNCERETTHRFETHESVPDETWMGQPICER